MPTKPESVDEYIGSFPETTRKILVKLREVIKTIAPEASESIAYGMPAYKTLGRPLVYFAGYEKHIGFYATPAGHAAFAKDLLKYKQGKGSVQFPLDEPLPYELIARIIDYRVKENKLKSNP